MILLLLACNGVRPTDQDGDGWLSNVDCNDLDPNVNPGMEEQPGDGTDNDCSLQTRDDDYDQDGVLGFEDCDDQDPTIPGIEVPYDGVDNDCDPETPDDDLDGDGVIAAEDCDDDDPEVSGIDPEVPYDGIDNDCDPETPDDDLDGDGLTGDVDCDDTNDAVGTEATWYEDCDGDGYAAEGAFSIDTCDPTGVPACAGLGAWTSIAPIGTPSSPGNLRIDCADLDPAVHPGQQNFFGFPISGVDLHWDYDCDGIETPLFGLYACEIPSGSSACDVTVGYLEPVACGGTGTLYTDCATISASTCIEQAPALETSQGCR